MSDRPVKLRIRVVPGAKSTGVLGRYGDAWKVRVTAPPERGRANDAVVALVARCVGVERPAVQVVAGLSSRDKVVELVGVSREEAERRLEAAGQEAG